MIDLLLQTVGCAHSRVLACLHRECFVQEWRDDAFDQLLKSPGCFGLLALARDWPVGFALVRVAASEGEILSIGVLPRQRNKGVGRFLLAGAAASVARKGGQCLFLEVAETHDAARTLYDSAGFYRVGKRNNYYTDPYGHREAAIIMRRDLNG